LGHENPIEAVRRLAGLIAADARNAEAWLLMARARGRIGDLAGAEAALKRSLAIDKRSAEARVALAELYAETGRPAEAEVEFRSVLARDRFCAAAATGLARRLLDRRKPQEAAQALAPVAASRSADSTLLQMFSEALKASGRIDEAVAAAERAAGAAPFSPIAWHNLAAALGDAERNQEAEAAARRALAQGLDAPETFLVLGRALVGQGRYGEAEEAFRQATLRRPDYEEAHRELAAIVWLRTESLEAASADLDRALAAGPALQGLAVVKAKLLDHAGDAAGAYALLAGYAAAPEAQPLLLAAAAQAALRCDAASAVKLAGRALDPVPDDPRLLAVLVEAQLSAGLADEAEATAVRLLQQAPNDQRAIALQAVAWRLTDDPRYHELYDYGAFVKPWRLDTPEGWSDLDDYLQDLTAALEQLHGPWAHPVGQSLRGGSQTSQSLRRSDDPAIRAFFQAIDGPIRRHMSTLGKGADPLRRRNRGRYRVSGVWSVRLRGGGFHVDHVHPEGWLSSACYIALPAAIARGREGWIRFGQPGVVTPRPLPAEHFVKPEVGEVVLFPSYMWHGTVPFEDEGRRLTIAFDLIPA
jgi:tetratricopeptide (TPR) repeat protein